ncbi:MAG: ATP-binding cassette domain-containing protein [Planctomycetota bacterium]
MSEAVLEARDVRKTYGKGHTLVEVLRGADLAVREGEFLVVVGHSGAGKSTLLHILGGPSIKCGAAGSTWCATGFSASSFSFTTCWPNSPRSKTRLCR